MTDEVERRFLGRGTRNVNLLIIKERGRKGEGMGILKVWQHPGLSRGLKFNTWTLSKCAYRMTNNRENAITEDSTVNLRRLRHKDWLTASDLLRILKQLKDAQSALHTLNIASQRRDYVPDEAVFKSVIHKYVREGQFNEIDGIILRMKKECCKFSDSFFRNLIRIFSNKAGNPKKALRIFLAMRDFQCFPSVKTFNFVLNMLVSSNDYETVHKLYLEAPNMAISPDICTFNILIKALCQMGKLDAAFSLLSEIPQQGLSANNTTYGTLMKYLSSSGKSEEVIKLFEKMVESGCNPDTANYNILISALSKEGRFEDAHNVLDEMKAKRCKRNSGSYHALLYGLLHNQMYQDGKELMHEMLLKKCLPGRSSYKSLVSGFCVKDNVDEATRMLKASLKRGIVPKMGTWNFLVRAVIGKNHEEVVRILEGILQEVKVGI
eukprot:TRINITY_DN2595_c0_g1_i3.p1 TRINITY_DN2595_c0_g1~~TRINITY_DN2595_c0_g1_i3.p1  ORF type:complete len:436 (-),score=67.28 TRINITY_DN2595_c0_g1_i3:136-1443(-)